MYRCCCSLVLLAGLWLCSAPVAQAEAPGRGELRLAPAEFDFSRAAGGGPGTSGMAAVQSVVVHGDPSKPGLYTLMLRIPPHTRIAAHGHPDERVGTVVAGAWRIGYGARFDAAALRELPAGSFYTEPAGGLHFAETGDSEVILHLSGIGPTGLIPSVKETHTTGSNP